LARQRRPLRGIVCGVPTEGVYSRDMGRCNRGGGGRGGKAGRGVCRAARARRLRADGCCGARDAGMRFCAVHKEKLHTNLSRRPELSSDTLQRPRRAGSPRLRSVATVSSG
jgi:hypothetical protein